MPPHGRSVVVAAGHPENGLALWARDGQTRQGSSLGLHQECGKVSSFIPKLSICAALNPNL